MLSGTGIATTQMVGTSTGRGDLYYAKVLVPGAAPAEVMATNETDGTSWTSEGDGHDRCDLGQVRPDHEDVDGRCTQQRRYGRDAHGRSRW